jgi:hypothetical protein
MAQKGKAQRGLAQKEPPLFLPDDSVELRLFSFTPASHNEIFH